MRRFIYTYILLIIGNITFTFAQETINIYHTNDTHSQIQPYTLSNNKSVGGIVRRATLMEERRLEDPNLLFFDSGDFVQGSVYFSIFKGKADIELMNTCHYDAACLGNHEFDNGIQNIADMVSWANFPIVCSNLDFTGTVLEGKIKPYVTFMRKDIKIGVFGLIITLDGLVMKKNYEGVQYLDYIDTAVAMVEKLRNEEHCDLVICLSHMGVNTDKVLAEKTQGIDIILGGHSHTYLSSPIFFRKDYETQTLVTQMGSKGRNVGHLIITMTEKSETE